MAQPNDYHLQYTFEPLNFSAPITLKTVTDGSVYNYNVARYRNNSETFSGDSIKRAGKQNRD